MPGRSTTEQIHTIRQLIEKTLEYKKKAYIAFVNFLSAFDTVDRQSLWLILQSAGVPKKIVNLFKELYNKTESAVFVNGQLSSHFQIRNGVRQGYCCSRTLQLCHGPCSQQNTAGASVWHRFCWKSSVRC